MIIKNLLHLFVPVDVIRILQTRKLSLEMEKAGKSNAAVLYNKKRARQLQINDISWNY